MKTWAIRVKGGGQFIFMARSMTEALEQAKCFTSKRVIFIHERPGLS